MKSYEHKITRFISSRAVTGMTSVIAIVAACYAMLISAPCVGKSVPQGVFDSLIWLPVADFQLQVIVNALLLLATVASLVLINKSFIIIHSPALLYVAVYLLAVAACGTDIQEIMEGLTLCLALLVTVTMMYVSYQKPRYTRTIFTVFLILGAGSMWQWAFALYIPVMIVVCAQMRCMGSRTMLAALMGIATAPWILWGFSFVSLPEFSLPELTTVTEALHDVAGWRDYQTLIAIALTLVVSLVMMIANIVRVYGANAKTRAFNGVLALITIVTMLGVVLDYGDSGVYSPLLCCCCGVQTGLYFNLYAEKRAYPVIIILVLAYIVLYMWRIWNLL
ncbi:MAG: hypothetical protein K2M94_04670 [Paramuribaculum sp.]|nr:hypothetical protein [Paramuribaculum sp.]